MRPLMMSEKEEVKGEDSNNHMIEQYLMKVLLNHVLNKLDEVFWKAVTALFPENDEYADDVGYPAPARRYQSQPLCRQP